MSSTEPTAHGAPDSPDTPGGSAGDLLLRPATAADAAACAALFTASRRAAGDAFPPAVHTAEEDVAFVAGRVADSEVWVAVDTGPDGDERVVGHLDLEPGWVHSLYVAPDAQGRGVGSALLDVAKAQRPDGFGLWVFASNTPARSFYARHGLVELETTDGSGNEEKAPDVRMVWPGRDPLAHLRRLIDEVDEGLAELVHRRVALTAAVQGVKPTPGHAGRDAAREREIAERLAALAPGSGLDVEQWQRLVHLLVEMGLDRGERRGG